MVYVDPLMQHGWKLHGKGLKSCHLVADSKEELLCFAKSIGLKKEWLQEGRMDHFDITHGKRQRAIAQGAKEISREELVIMFIRYPISKGEVA